MHYRLLTWLAIAFITACNGDLTRTYKSPLPGWYYSPDIPGHTGISVSAPIQSLGGIEAQRRVALTKARAELGRITRINVRSDNVIHESGNKEITHTDMQNQTRLSSTEALDLSAMQVKEEWIDPVTQELYIWVILPKK